MLLPEGGAPGWARDPLGKENCIWTEMMLLEGRKAERELVVPGRSWCSHELSPALGGCRQGSLQAGLTAGRAGASPARLPGLVTTPPCKFWV